MVWATAVPATKKATKLKNAAQRTASLGDRTRVETMVEMALAASCMPLVKSKARARKMTNMIKGKPISKGYSRCNSTTPAGNPEPEVKLTVNVVN